jgi:hypothetical protein
MRLATLSGGIALIDARLATQPIAPETNAPDRRRVFRVTEGVK